MYLYARMLALEWKGTAFIEKVNSRCFCLFPEAILVDQLGPPIWRFHTIKLYKGKWNVSANNSETVGHKDPRFGQIVLKHFIFLASSTGRFLIYFLCRVYCVIVDLKVPGENAATARHIFKLGAADSPITSNYKCLSYRGESKAKVKNFICFVLVPARATVSSSELWGKK